ncbi:MAG: hypothetical protein HKP61_23485 [Dactylosporangium sp.]|nr:hypothetical protein [Dactylosporangium sp.]NNJ63842.1 hypothetical protein [Dactylosporangium sp.]
MRLSEPLRSSRDRRDRRDRVATTAIEVSSGVVRAGRWLPAGLEERWSRGGGPVAAGALPGIRAGGRSSGDGGENRVGLLLRDVEQRVDLLRRGLPGPQARLGKASRLLVLGVEDDVLELLEDLLARAGVEGRPPGAAVLGGDR